MRVHARSNNRAIGSVRTPEVNESTPSSFVRLTKGLIQRLVDDAQSDLLSSNSDNNNNNNSEMSPFFGRGWTIHDVRDGEAVYFLPLRLEFSNGAVIYSSFNGGTIDGKGKQAQATAVDDGCDENHKHTHTHMRTTQRVDDEPVLYFVSFRTTAC